MQLKEISKNSLRLALTDFYLGIIQNFNDKEKSTKPRTLKHMLEKITTDIKQAYREEHADEYKDALRKILKEEVNEVMSRAKEISVKGQCKHGHLLYDLFDGVPLVDTRVLHRQYDLVVQIDTERCESWVFAPKPQEYDPIQAQIEAEKDFGLQCIGDRVIREFPASLEKNDQNTKCLDKEQFNTDSQTDSAENLGSKLKIVGKVLFSKGEEYILKDEKSRDEIKGYFFEEYAESFTPLDTVVLESQEAETKIYATITRMNIRPLSGGGYVHKFTETAYHALFKPLLEVSEGYQGRVRPKDLSGYIIRQPNNEELRQVFNIPSKGLPLGRLDYYGSNEVFYYPTTPEDTLYQSAIIAGVQGKGKTNGLKTLIRSVITANPMREPPAVIILDGEGEYKDFTNIEKMTESAKQFLKKHGLGEVKPNVYTVSDDASHSTATMTLRAIGKDDVIYLLPELEARTENILRVLINSVSRQLEEENIPQTVDVFRERLMAENRNSQLIHQQQRPAIARAILSNTLSLLDQKDKTPLTPNLLFKPGTVSVIDYQSLEPNNKRAVALYLLQLLNREKMNKPNFNSPVLLVIDEAEVLFPKSPSKPEKDYVERIESRMEDITNRGRKRKYGVVLVTHLPTEISQKVGDLANTKIAFGCAGAEKWVRQHFGKEYVSEVNELPTGTCRVKININSNTQGPINVRLRLPYLGDSNAIVGTGDN